MSECRSTSTERRIVRLHMMRMTLVFLVGAIATTTTAQEVALSGPALSFVDAAARLAEVSDAVAAADANVRGRRDLLDATRSLRLPHLTLEARWLEFEKELELPLGS